MKQSTAIIILLFVCYVNSNKNEYTNFFPNLPAVSTKYLVYNNIFLLNDMLLYG